MKIRPQVIFSLIVFIFLVYFVYEAREWRLQARLYPWVIGIPMVVLALVQIFLDLKGVTKSKPSDGAPMDFQFGQAMDSTVARRRTVNIFSWILGFLVGIWLLGFSVAIPAMVFLYLKFQSGEKWLLSIILTSAAWFLFWGLFDWLLRLPFPEAQLFLWLGLQ